MGNNKKGVIVKLTSFEPFRKETPIYRAQAYSNDKSKGNMMIQYLKSIFNIGSKDEENHLKEEIKEQKKISIRNFGSNKINWTRDEDGKIISPFSKKAKKKTEDEEPEK